MFPIAVPPLRERPEDVPSTGPHVHRGVQPGGSAGRSRDQRGGDGAPARYRWPGNVRELRNVMQRAVARSGTGIIGVEHLPDNVRRLAGPTPVAAGNSVTPIRAMERDMILRALVETDQDKRRAAQLLGISLEDPLQQAGEVRHPGGEVGSPQLMLPADLAEILHDLRGPLNSITLHLGVLKRTARGDAAARKACASRWSSRPGPAHRDGAGRPRGGRPRARPAVPARPRCAGHASAGRGRAPAP